MSTLPNALAQRAGVRKKKPLPKGTATMTIEPRQPEIGEHLDNPPEPKVELDYNRKLKRIQRA
jgi:hypothetical protein